MVNYRDADRESYAKMTSEQEFYEENKPLTRLEHSVRKRKFDALLSIIGEIKNKSILSIGCGAGMDCEWAALEGANVFGIEVSSRLIKLAKRRFKRKKLNAKFIVGDMENLPFKPKIFDIVFSYDALHHSNSLLRSLLEVKKVTKKSIGIVEPNENCLTRKLANIFFKNSLIEHSGLPSKAFSIIFYIKEFKQAGFSVKKTLFSSIIPPEVCAPNFKISYGIFGPVLSLLAPQIDYLFEKVFPYSCSACVLVGEKN